MTDMKSIATEQAGCLEFSRENKFARETKGHFTVLTNEPFATQTKFEPNGSSSSKWKYICPSNGVNIMSVFPKDEYRTQILSNWIKTWDCSLYLNLLSYTRQYKADFNTFSLSILDPNVVVAINGSQKKHGKVMCLCDQD